MQRVQKPYVKFFPRLRLYREDLVEATTMLLASFRTVELEANGYRIAHLEELDRLPTPELTEVKIYACNPSIAKDIPDNKLRFQLPRDNLIFTLDKHQAHLWLQDKHNTLLRGAEVQFDAILLKRRVTPAPMHIAMLAAPSPLIGLWCVVLAVLLLAGSAWLGAHVSSVLRTAIVDGGLVLGVLTGGWGFYVAASPHARISMTSRRSHRTFLQRNEDALLVGVILLLVGAMLNVLLR